MVEANNGIASLNTRISTLRSKLDDISEARLKILHKFADDVITAEEKSELIDSLDTQKIELSFTLSELQSQQSIRESDIEMAINLMGNVDKQWSTSTFDVQIRFQSMLFPSGVSYDPTARSFGASEISPLYGYVGIEKDTEVSLNSDLVAGPGLEPGTSWL
jgi:hypothetical protein